MKPKELGFGMEIWVVRRPAVGAEYVDGPFRIVAFDQKMVYAAWKGNGFGEFFPVENVALEHEAAKENAKRRNVGQ